MIKNELNQKLQLTCIVCALLSGTNYLHANGKWLDRHEKEIIPTVKKLTEEGIHINGTVRDSQGEPLSGVNIVIKGQTIGTTTDIDGNYFLEVPSRSSILVFTYIGFEEQEIVVGNQININLNMHEISTGLNEVVVVGYGSQKRASIVGSITTIEPQVLSQGTTRALSNNLAGNVAGVIAVQRSGEPGADGSNFWIRGISSFQGAGTSPLVLVDGIERTLDDLNPAEIESFSVLKDASASAVYGVRGANGVILVQTKRGKLGKPTVNVHFEQSFTQPTKLPQYIGSAEYLTLLNEIAKDNGQQQSPYSQETIDHYINRTDPDLYPDVNWMDLITKDFAMNQRADITVNGGSDILRYAVVGSYYGEQGIFERDKSQSWNSGTHLNKFNLRSNVDINITKTTQLTVSVGGYLQEMNKMAISSDDAFSGAFETPPFIHPAYYKEDDNIYFPVVNQRVNPYVQVTQKGYATTSQSKIESLFALEQDLKFITPGLKIKGIFSFDRYSWSGVTRSKTPDLYQPATQRDENGNLILNISSYGQQFLSTSENNDWGNKATYVELNLNYERTFGKHQVEGLFLYNQRDYQQFEESYDIVPYRRMGIAGRASYTYDNRYIAEFNFGYNGSENFAKGYQFGFFPAYSVAWNIAEEPIIRKNLIWMNMFKLRYSFGKVGNDFLATRFPYLSTYKTEDKYGYHYGDIGTANSSGVFYPGLTYSKFASRNITWEVSEKHDLGLDFSLFNDKLNGTIDYFHEQREGIYMQRSYLPFSIGLLEYQPFANVGSVKSEGFDGNIAYNHKLGEVDFTFRANMTYSKNEIKEYDEVYSRYGYTRQKGFRVGQLRGLIAEGLFRDYEEIRNSPTQTFGDVAPGDIKYKDVNGDGLITDADVVPIGATDKPNLIYGFGLSAMWKGFDFNLHFQGAGKSTFSIEGAVAYPFSQGYWGNIMTDVDGNYWSLGKNENPNAKYPRLSFGGNANNYRTSTYWMRDGSYLRLKNLEVGYTLPTKWTNRIHLNKIRVYFMGTNLLTFSKFDLWDPEMGSTTGEKYPLSRTFTLGLTLNL